MDQHDLTTQLLEKKRNGIQRDIEALEKSRNRAHTEISLQIQNNKQDVERLKTEAMRLQNLCILYSDALIDLQKEVHDFGKADIEAAKQKVKEIYSDAEVVKKQAEDLLANAKAREEAVEKRETAVKTRETEAERVDNENQATLQLLDNKKTEVDNAEADSKKALAQAQDLLDDISRRLDEKRTEEQKLDELIQSKQKTAEVTGNIAAERLKAVERRELVVAGKEKQMSDKETTLTNKEIWLNDREQTVQRAYNEVISRGGKVD